MSPQPPSGPSVVDGVHRAPLSGISVLVVGAGVGGLLAALECWRSGHAVRMLEKDAAPSPVGDMFGLVSSAGTTLRHYPALAAAFERHSYDTTMSIWHYAGPKIVPPREAPWNAPGAASPALPVRVPLIQSRTATCLLLDAQRRRLGIEAAFGQHAVEYGEDAHGAWVRTAAGQVWAADLVVAADGVGTAADLHITGGSKVRAVSSGFSCLRGLVPRAAVEAMSLETRRKLLGSDRDEFRIYLARDMHCNVIISRDGVCFVLTHKDDQVSSESWNRPSTREAVLATVDSVQGWDPAVVELFHALPQDPSPSTFRLPALEAGHEAGAASAAYGQGPPEPAEVTAGVIDYKLVWRSPDPRWASPGGRVVKLGDAAHSFLPTSGNGAAQAMEDAISLAACLRLGGKDRMQDAVRAHVTMRFERTSTLQHFGLANRQHMHNLDIDAALDDPALVKMDMGRWIWAHDPGRYAEDNFDRALRHVMGGEPFENTNLPPGHKYVPWTVEGEFEAEQRGELSTFMATGDWS